MKKGNIHTAAMIPKEAGSGSWMMWQSLQKRVEIPISCIEPVDGNPEVTVTYTAEEGSGFQGSVTRSFGRVFKKAYEVPKAPVVTADAEDDTREGSILKLESSEVDDVYYYLRLDSEGGEGCRAGGQAQ